MLVSDENMQPAHSEDNEKASSSEHGEETPMKNAKIDIQIQKTFLEEKGKVVFYEVNIHVLEAFSMHGEADNSLRELAADSIVTIHRRYKHFKYFHKKLTSILVSMCKTNNDKQLWLRRLPKLPPLRPKFLVDHCSPFFVSDRSRALQSYLTHVLGEPFLVKALSPELVKWLTDRPEPFYALSIGDCPYLYRCWEIFHPSNLPSWNQSDRHDDTENANSNTCGQAHRGALSNRENDCCSRKERNPEDPQLYTCVDAAINGKFSMWRGNIWQLKVDAIGLDAPGDYVPLPGSAFSEMMRVAGLRAKAEIRMLDEARIGDVAVISCRHGLNLPASHVLITGSAYFAPEHESASYSGLHLCYLKLLEAAADHGCRTIAIDCMFADKCFPKMRAAHVALRTLRWFLVCYGSVIDRVVLVCMNDADHDTLHELAPVYFPRNDQEAIHTKDLWAERNLNQSGDYYIQERRCRIGIFPSDSSKQDMSV